MYTNEISDIVRVGIGLVSERGIALQERDCFVLSLSLSLSLSPPPPSVNWLISFMKLSGDTIRGHPCVLCVNFCGTLVCVGHFVTIFISDLSDLQLFLRLVLVYDS
jgi:hypothetical protein